MYLLFKIFVLFILQRSIDPRYVPNISKRKNGSEIKWASLLWRRYVMEKKDREFFVVVN